MFMLQATKLHQPPAASNRVPRPQLVERLNEGLAAGRRLTLVSAAAGFGKTSCLSEWLHGLALPVAWLSLDSGDDDPGRFFGYLVAALQTIDAGFGPELAAMLQAGHVPPVPALATQLLNDILSLHRKFILVLDDFHAIRSGTILDTIGRLIAGQPGVMHLVLVTREDPQLPLARLRASEQLTEIRAADLRFSMAEAGGLLNGLMKLSLSEEDISALEDRTEGWAVGLLLAGLSLRGRPDPARFIANLSGSHRFILSYLTEEVLSRQPEDVQSFLLQTSILEKLSGDLCDAVTGRSDGAELLEMLLAANLFLIPLDDDRRWYRYHHLFAELLRNLLAARQKDQVAELHRRVGVWYARAGMPGDAMRHALNAADYEMAIHLLESHAIGMIVQGYVKTVADWLQAIPLEQREQSPRANLAMAWQYLLQGVQERAAPYVDRLRAILPDSRLVTDPSLQAEWLALRSYLCVGQGEATEGLDLARQAVAAAPEHDGYVRSLAHNALGCAYLLMDDYAHAVDAYQQAILHGRAADNPVLEMVGVSILAQMAVEHGQLHLAHRVASEGIRRYAPGGERPGFLPPSFTIAHNALAHVYYQWNQPEEADALIRHALRLCSLGEYSDLEAYHRVSLSRLLQLAGDFEAAGHEVRKALDRLGSEGADWVRKEALAQQVRLCLAAGDLKAAENALKSHGVVLPGEIPIEDGVAPSLPDHLTHSAGRLCNSVVRLCLHQALLGLEPERTRSAIELAGSLIRKALQGQYVLVALEALLLRARLYKAWGDEQGALADCVTALELARPEGFITAFVDEGAPIAGCLATLLDRHELSTGQRPYVHAILRAMAGSLPAVTSQGASAREGAPAGPALIQPAGLVEPLTPRELEVLHLVAAGCSNQEIAGRLVLSLHTVKRHISNILAKLDANSRTQALARARQLGLLAK